MRKTFVLVVLACIISSIGGGYLAYRLLKINGTTIVVKEKEYIHNSEEGVGDILKNLEKSEVRFDVSNIEDATTEIYTGYSISNDNFVILPYIQSVIEKTATLSLHQNPSNIINIYPDPLKNFIIASIPVSENKLVKPIEFESNTSQYPGKKVFLIEHTALFQYKFFASYITEFIENHDTVYSSYVLDRPITIGKPSFVFSYNGKLIGTTLLDKENTYAFTSLSRINSVLESIDLNQSIQYATFPFTFELVYLEGYPVYYGASIKNVSKENFNIDLLPGDIIFAVNNREIEEYTTFLDLISENLPGDTVQLKIFRYNDAVSKEQGSFHESFEKQTFEIPIVLSEF